MHKYEDRHAEARRGGGELGRILAPLAGMKQHGRERCRDPEIGHEEATVARHPCGLWERRKRRPDEEPAKGAPKFGGEVTLRAPKEPDEGSHGDDTERRKKRNDVRSESRKLGGDTEERSVRKHGKPHGERHE